MGVQENQITSQETNDTTNGNNNNNNNSNSGSVLVNGATTPGNNHRDSSFKGNEDRKIFVGGIAYDVTNDDLTNYFSQFGEVSQAQVKFDRTTGRSRGFAFVEFATADACKVALNQRIKTNITYDDHSQEVHITKEYLQLEPIGLVFVFFFALILVIQFTAMLFQNEIKLSEQRKSKHGGVSTKLRGFLKPTGWKPLTILFLFFSFQQFSGIYITLFYAVTWFQEVGSGVDAYIASILVGVTRFLCSMVNTWLLRRYKRRLLCIVSSLGMAFCMTVSGYYTYLIKNGDRSGYWVPVVCLLLYVCTSMVGMLTIPWTMTAELFPTDIRGIAHSISYSIANLLMFAALQSYRSLQSFLGGSHAVQWFFAGVSITAVVFVWLLLPETHGKKLSEIEEYFQNHFLAVGAEAKTKKRRAQRKQQRIDKSATQPLNPKTIQNV